MKIASFFSFRLFLASFFLFVSFVLYPEELIVDYRQEMRNFVIEISKTGRVANSNFIVVPQNAQEIAMENGASWGTLYQDYIAAIDGTAREDLFYGYDDDNMATEDIQSRRLINYLVRYQEAGKTVLAIDYCWDMSKVGRSIEESVRRGFLSFPAPDRELSVIPKYPSTPVSENKDSITDLSQARNFLYLINPAKFEEKNDFLNAVRNTNYDVLILDLFYNDEPFSPQEIHSLRSKKNGAPRLVLCYMSIGEAEDYRYYWKDEWTERPPVWLERENLHWEGNYKVRYWEPEWQKIIFGGGESYLSRIMEAGFDGVYLDIIDAFEYFEDLD